MDLSWSLGGKTRFSDAYLNELNKQHQWCFIVGCNNSGTSLTQSILSRSDRVSAFHFEGQRYTRAITRASRRGHERVWTEFLDELRMTENDPSEPSLRLFHDWYTSLNKPVEELIVEKTTANVVRMRWLQAQVPSARFIVLVRDGYAVVEGIYRKGERDIRRAARHWNTVYKIAVQDAQQLDNLMFLKYEDLVGKHDETCQKLADFTGIDYDTIASATAGGISSDTAKGLDYTTIRDFNLASKQRLSDDDRLLIEQEAGELLTHFGYTR